MCWPRAPTSGRSTLPRSSPAPMAVCPCSRWRSSRRARVWTAWSAGSRASRRAAAWPSWATSPISAAWCARCSPPRTGRSWSCVRARPACSSSRARWGAAPLRWIGFSVRSTSGSSAPRVTKRPEGLLTAPAPGAARRIALNLLDAATAARQRLTDADDAEALHDFRVAMRRLRSTLRAYETQVDALVPAKLRRRLRELARATGEARDVEVQIAWLERRRTELPPGRRAGVPWLMARLTERRDRTYQDIRERIAPKFDRLARRLRRPHELAVGGARAAAARGPKPATSGLLALARVARATQERLFRRLVSRGLPRAVPAELAALAAELRPPAGPAVTPVAEWPSRAPARPPRPLPARYRHRPGA